MVIRIAGNARPGYSGDGGSAISTQLANPQGVAVDTAGNIFIGDLRDHRIRKVSPDGIITTVAGNSTISSNHGGRGGFSGDCGPVIDAQLNYPTDVAVDGAGNLYIADYENSASEACRETESSAQAPAMAHRATRAMMDPATEASF